MIQGEKDTAEINHLLHKANPFGKFIYWIGLTDRLVEGEFTWESEGRSLDYANWASGEPNGHKYSEEDCVHTDYAANDRRWNDRNCADSWVYALCEIGNFKTCLTNSWLLGTVVFLD